MLRYNYTDKLTIVGQYCWLSKKNKRTTGSKEESDIKIWYPEIFKIDIESSDNEERTFITIETDTRAAILKFTCHRKTAIKINAWYQTCRKQDILDQKKWVKQKQLKGN